MRTEIKKWGNSAVVRLPAAFLAELNLAVGSPIELRQENGYLVVEPIAPFRKGWFDGPLQADSDLLADIPLDEGDGEWQW